jgi:hypothetical protein
VVAQGLDENWHGHVTALTVAPEFRRIGLGATAHACLKLKFAPSPAGAPFAYTLTLTHTRTLINTPTQTDTNTQTHTYTAHHLMNELEEISEKKHNGYFVDLFVRAVKKKKNLMSSNKVLQTRTTATF